MVINCDCTIRSNGFYHQIDFAQLESAGDTSRNTTIPN